MISEAGDDPKVVGLVYVAAFMPDVGESVFGLIPKSDAPPPFTVTDGQAFLTGEAFLHAFAPDVGDDLAAFMYASQVPIAVAEAGAAPLPVAAWRGKPSWYALAAGDLIIPPDAQRFFAGRAGSTVVELDGSHVAFVGPQAEAVARLIEKAATGIAVQ